MATVDRTDDERDISPKKYTYPIPLHCVCRRKPHIFPLRDAEVAAIDALSGSGTIRLSVFQWPYIAIICFAAPYKFGIVI